MLYTLLPKLSHQKIGVGNTRDCFPSRDFLTPSVSQLSFFLCFACLQSFFIVLRTMPLFNAKTLLAGLCAASIVSPSLGLPQSSHPGSSAVANTQGRASSESHPSWTLESDSTAATVSTSNTPLYSPSSSATASLGATQGSLTDDHDGASKSSTRSYGVTTISYSSAPVNNPQRSVFP